MSLEYFEKYNFAPRKPTHTTIDDPVVILLGLTMAVETGERIEALMPAQKRMTPVTADFELGKYVQAV